MDSKILLVEDDQNLGSLVREYLEAKGYIVHLCLDGQEGYDTFMKKQFDLCIIDIMLPIKDGFTLAKEIRAINDDIPILFLTARSMKEDILKGFKIGADDYVTKPFSMEELLYRIEAILRRIRRQKDIEKQPTIFYLGNIVFDYNLTQLTIKNKKKQLTTKEADLLRLLCIYANDLLERSYALKTIWGNDSYFNARSMDVYITKLRKHLKDEPNVEIVNVHAKGFKLLIRNQ